MRELKIFLVVVIFTGLVYWGVEPFAHSQMNAHVEPANFNFMQEDINYAKSVISQKTSELAAAQNELNSAKSSQNAEQVASAETKVKGATNALESAKANLSANEALWARVNEIDLAKGDAVKGSEFFTTYCYTCHGLKQAGLEGNIPDSSIYGVLPPDLSSTAMIYDEKFLAALIMQPSLALKVDHKFGLDGFIMTPYNDDVSGESKEITSENIANVIAYLKEVAKDYEKGVNENINANLKAKYAKITDISESDKFALMEKEATFQKAKNTYIEACGRCHDMRYDGFKALSAPGDLLNYLGSNPPDLSMMIRARSGEYLNNFINNTQKVLPGTAMPRVGLHELAQKQVLSYMEQIGDSKKDEREFYGIAIMLFFLVLSGFAWAWKRKIWSELH